MGHPQPDTVAYEIVWLIRLSRVLLAAVIGAALTTAGTVVQALVRNALADPFLLGVSSGASVGATAVLLFGAFASLGVWSLSVGSVLGALGAMAAVFMVSRTGRQLPPTQLILCGVVLSALFESVTSFLIFRSLNALAMGSEPAASLGVDVARLRRNLFIVTCCSVRRSWSSGTCWPGPSCRRRRCQSGSSPPSSALAAAKEKFLETSPITKNLTAVNNRCFLPLSYDEVTPSPRNAEAIVAIAHWQHPTAFGHPADGS